MIIYRHESSLGKASLVTNNHFTWFVPRNWDSTEVTRFTQHAASVGAPNFRLSMDLDTRVDAPGYKCHPHEPLHEDCRANLDRWMKQVYYGVETRGEQRKAGEGDGCVFGCGQDFLNVELEQNDVKQSAEGSAGRGYGWEAILESLKAIAERIRNHAFVFIVSTLPQRIIWMLSV
ncbi:hypothetical protein UCDDA912_g03767 [Diaporthe ampelina]|uniref:Uncharacterized protein n=1 Tax=Diaporthe ampelina TaxID=1214573 RepID=A0A0G2FQE6_9PEZI|nr:hypothetical protein UCDDA912_g03767 [Diaporthe ampelina]